VGIGRRGLGLGGWRFSLPFECFTSRFDFGLGVGQ
jgi:hypothetical protein